MIQHNIVLEMCLTPACYSFQKINANCLQLRPRKEILPSFFVLFFLSFCLGSGGDGGKGGDSTTTTNRSYHQYVWIGWNLKYLKSTKNVQKRKNNFKHGSAYIRWMSLLLQFSECVCIYARNLVLLGLLLKNNLVNGDNHVLAPTWNLMRKRQNW